MAYPTSDTLSRFVLPLFVPSPDDPDVPDRAGSCVLVKLFGRPFVVTARHVFGRSREGSYFFGQSGTKLVPFNVGGLYTVNAMGEDIDIAVMPITLNAAVRLESDGLRFVPEGFVETEVVDYSTQGGEFIVFGFPDSNSQFRRDRPSRNIIQNSFLLRTSAHSTEVARREGVNTETHVLVQFDPRAIEVAGRPYNPPKPRGISGGGLFHIADGQVKLAGIPIKNLRGAKAIQCVRSSEVVAVAYSAIAGLALDSADTASGAT